ncbi:LamG domain-containing protein [Nitrosopumilus piranensis]|uniref:LamG-like jellyroll fold domain-containing protein n=1 Tax=Nitrosopumilus piranensis TaxID=1582439 RepID=A0A0C5BQ24_9ARCH|nr:LamG domain-containing protein [Nitrosopumilus piranensis]AJM91808.1 exported protein of unknown function [Nitrosopumilus piranensis]
MISKTIVLAMTLFAGMLGIVSTTTADADISHKLLIYPNESDLAGTENLVGVWNFDNTLQDSSQNGNDGVISVGSELYVDSTYGGGFTFDNNDADINLSNENNFDFDYDDPFSLVVKIDGWNDLGTETQFFIKSALSPVTTDSMIVGLLGGEQLAFRQYDTSGVVHFCESATRFADGDYIFAVTYDGTDTTDCSGVRMWANGVEETVNDFSSGTMTTILNDEAPKIGGWSGTPNGSIDFIRIYDDVLTESEIWAIGNMTGFVDVGQRIIDLESENTSLQNQITSVNGTVQDNVAEIDDLYDFWDDLRASIITWLAGRP